MTINRADQEWPEGMTVSLSEDGAEVIGKRTAKPRTPGAPLELGFNFAEPEDLLKKVRGAK